MKQVFYHNEIDILSLVSLTIMLNQIHEQPIEKLDNHIDLTTLANHYENSKQWQQNIPIYQSLIESESDQEAKTELCLRLGYCYKSLGQWENAVAIWEQALTTGKFRIETYEELAKYYEHRVRDFTRAEQLVQQALTNLEFVEQVRYNSYSADHRKNLTHRLQRIQRKKVSNEKL
jgi:tetratricopeptide (TPR) repeat protein